MRLSIITVNLNNIKKIKPFIDEQGLSNKIKFLGFVPDVKLFELYHPRRTVVVPTIFETGSFPLIECILMGILVICTNAISLPETLGGC